MNSIVQPIRPPLPARPARSAAQPNTRVHDWAHASTRMLVSTFFIASAAANMDQSAFHVGALLGPQQTELVFNAMIYGMAFAVLVGRFVHIAALVLALVLLSSSILELSAGLKDLESFWRDLAITGALFAMAVSNGNGFLGAISRRRTKAGVVTPRRPVMLEANSADSALPQMHGRMQVARPVAMPVFRSSRSR